MCVLILRVQMQWHAVIEYPKHGEVLQFQGDQRENICQWLTTVGLVKPEQLQVHGS
jgi:translation initiation factor 1